MFVRVQKWIQTPITKNREVLFYQLHNEDNVLTQAQVTSTYIYVQDCLNLAVTKKKTTQ